MVTAETLPAMILASSTTAAITTTMTGVMTTGTTIVRDNNTVTNEIAMMVIMISVATLTTMTYVLALNRELWTMHPMKPVVAWSTMWSTVPRAPKQFTDHLRQVIWPRGFKLQKA
jgi:hypothetical protein